VTPSRRPPGPIATEKRLGAHARQAVREALGFGLTVGELGQVLEGLDPTDLVPPHLDEDPVDYGPRAASEIMVRYLVA